MSYKGILVSHRGITMSHREIPMIECLEIHVVQNVNKTHTGYTFGSYMIDLTGQVTLTFDLHVM